MNQLSAALRRELQESGIGITQWGLVAPWNTGAFPIAARPGIPSEKYPRYLAVGQNVPYTGLGDGLGLVPVVALALVHVPGLFDGIVGIIIGAGAVVPFATIVLVTVQAPVPLPGLFVSILVGLALIGVVGVILSAAAELVPFYY